ncbi:MAG: 3-isopropylmalate dehydratase [Candidatus Aminicenantes bacterium]|nr:3-isopropylmalate dehydratase [Candidatus Aminicenantes bacterium]
MKLEGRVWIFKENDINTDLIYPGKYTYEPLSNKEQAAHAMEDFDPGFSKEVKKHDILVTGNNFGCGSSREQAVTCLKYAGIDAIIASSFARLFYRNAINSALAVIESPQLVEFLFDKTRKGGSRRTEFSLTIDLTKGTIHTESSKFSFPAWDEQAMLIFKSGGLVEFTKQLLKTS